QEEPSVPVYEGGRGVGAGQGGDDSLGSGAAFFAGSGDADRLGDGYAFAVGVASVAAMGPRSAGGQSAPGASDLSEPSQERQSGCALPGGSGQRASEFAPSDRACLGPGAGGSSRVALSGCLGSLALAPDPSCSRLGEGDGRSFAELLGRGLCPQGAGVGAGAVGGGVGSGARADRSAEPDDPIL